MTYASVIWCDFSSLFRCRTSGCIFHRTPWVISVGLFDLSSVRASTLDFSQFGKVLGPALPNHPYLSCTGGAPRPNIKGQFSSRLTTRKEATRTSCRPCLNGTVLLSFMFAKLMSVPELDIAFQAFGAGLCILVSNCALR